MASVACASARFGSSSSALQGRGARPRQRLAGGRVALVAQHDVGRRRSPRGPARSRAGARSPSRSTRSSGAGPPRRACSRRSARAGTARRPRGRRASTRARRASRLGRERELDPGRDGARHLALQREHVLQVALVALGPELRLVAGLDQLGGDADPAGVVADAALDDVVHAQVAPDRGDVAARALVPHRRGARDHRQALGLQASELGDHLLGQPFAEVLLLGVAAQVLERQHRELHAPGRRGPRRQPLAAQQQHERQARRQARQQRADAARQRSFAPLSCGRAAGAAAAGASVERRRPRPRPGR